MSAIVSQSQNSQSSAKMPSMAPVGMNSNSMNPTPNRSGNIRRFFFLFSKTQKTQRKINLTYSAFRGWAGTEISLIFWSV